MDRAGVMVQRKSLDPVIRIGRFTLRFFGRFLAVFIEGHNFSFC